jgi:hypothetical protein
MSIADEAGTSRPLGGNGEIISVDVFKFVEDLRFEGVVVHGVDEDSSLSIEGVRTLINIDNEHKFFKNTHTSHVLGSRVERAIDKRFECGVDGSIEVDFIIVLAGG